MAWRPRGGNPWGSVPPAGGGRGGEGGDDFIGRFQDRMGGFVPPFLRGKGFATLLLALLAVALISTTFYRVQTAEQGVVQRFGQWVRTEPQGFHIKLPALIEKVTIVDVAQVRRVDVGFRTGQDARRTGPSALLEERLMLTGDENIVDIAFTVFWVVSDAKSFLFNIQSPQEKTVKEVAESVMREIIGKTEIQVALTQGRGDIQAEVRDKLQQVLDLYGAGIRITEIRLERVDPPAEVIDSFRDVQAAAADRERVQNEAQAYANTIIPEARGQAVRMIQEAEAYKQQVIARSTGEASRFTAVYLEYAKARDVTKRRIYLETMEEVLSGMNKVIIDDKAGTGVVPYLPLPELDAKRKQEEGGQWSPALLKILLALGAAFLAVNSLFTVSETDQALVLQLGEYKRTVQQPGLHVKLPLIQNVVFLDKRILNLDVPPQEVIASDRKRLVVDAIARFRIIDPLLTYQTRGNEAGAAEALTTQLSSSVREVLARAEFLTLLSPERAAMMLQIRDSVNAAARSFGIEIVDVRIRRADLPEANSLAIFRRMNTEREREARELRAQGQEQALRIRAEAERTRTVLTAEAERDSQILRGQGDSEATRIFAEAFGKDPAFFEFYRSMQAYRRAFTPDDTTLVLSPSSDFLKFFESMAGTPRR